MLGKAAGHEDGRGLPVELEEPIMGATGVETTFTGADVGGDQLLAATTGVELVVEIIAGVELETTFTRGVTAETQLLVATRIVELVVGVAAGAELLGAVLPPGTKMSSWAPGRYPHAPLYPGLTNCGGWTLLPSAWFHTIICFAPLTHVEASSLQ